MSTDVENTDAAEAVGFACALCGKSFARRDLRNRHRRRCEKSINRVKVSKKRSCEACGRSKLRCDLVLPACSRCQSRGIACQYPNDTAAQAAQQNSARNASVSSISTDLSFMSEEFLNGPLNPSASSTTPVTKHSTPTHVNSHPGEQSPVFATVLDDVLLDGFSVDSEAFSRSSTGFWDSSSMGAFADDMSLSDPFSQSCSLQSDFSLPTLDAIPTDEYDFSPSSRSSANFFSEHDVPPEQQLPVRLAASNKQDEVYSSSVFDVNTTPSTSPAATVSDSLYSVMPHNLGDSSTLTSSSVASPKATNFAMPPSSPISSVANVDLMTGFTQPLLTPPMSRNTSISSVDSSYKLHLGAHLFNIEEAAAIICNYPQKMLDRTYRSPFVHSKLQHGTGAEPIAVALCCVSAKLQSVESSLPFVCKMIDSQREQLINDFPKKQMSLDETSAFLHALCIYQIESMLALRESRPKNAILSAELHHNFLLKMARTAFRTRPHLLRNVNTQQLDHQSWAAIESLRRNLFLLNMINDLSFATKALNGHYYEPLEEEYLVDLPLPAPEAMWRASNASDWMQARDNASWNGAGVLSLGQAITKLNRGEDLGELEPLQRLVVSCAWKRVRSA